jgi:hypothetical protein
MRILKLALAVGLFAAVFPAVASADRINLDFESGPPLRTPVQDDYLAAGFVKFPHDPGFRPYRTDVGNRAHSGHVVVDVGGDLCPLEFPGAGADCEFVHGGTTAILTRTATAVTVFAGTIDPSTPAETIQLIGHRTNGTDVTSATVTIDGSTGVTTPVSVSSPAGDIDGFTLTSNGGDVAFDDLTLDFPTNSLPDINPTTTNQVVPLLDGSSTQVPVDLGRVNGSNGPVQISVAGVPQGVTASVAGNPVTADNATITLTAAPDAPSTDFRPVDMTVIADPMHNASVAPAVRSTRLDMRVASPFDLQLAPGASPDTGLPACAPVSVPVQIPRDIALNETVHMSVTGLPAGVTATILPSPDVAPGGGLTADRTIQLTRTSGSALPADVTVQAQTASITRTMTLHLADAAQTATALPGFGFTSRLEQGVGSQITVTGNGFCPGTRVLVGNSFASADATVVDPQTLSFRVPRLATTGPVTIVPPAGDPAYQSVNSLHIDSFRNVDAFPFANFSFDGLSLGELTDAYGAQELFISVNPCGLFGGDCRIVTPIPNALTAIEWPIISKALSSSNGHCFGISRAVQEFLEGKKNVRDFSSTGLVFDVPSAARASTGVIHFLDGQHSLQASDQFLSAWFTRFKTVGSQTARVQNALPRGDYPIVTLQHGLEGHAVLAYDSVTNPDGTVDVYVYDSNRPFTPSEDANGGVHAAQVNQSVLHLDPAGGKWSYLMADGTTWQGGGNTIFAVPESVIPQNPSLPGLSTLASALAGLEFTIFGSQDQSVRIAGSPSPDHYLPALDSHAVPGTGGTIVSGKRGGPTSTQLVGRKRGHYSAAVVGNGFAASVSDVATQRGVHDDVRGQSDSLTFGGGMDRPLTVDLAEQPKGAMAWSATLHTRADAGGSDGASLAPSGTLGYTHQGSATTVSFTLSGVRTDGEFATFVSGPLRIEPGDRLAVRPGAGMRAAALTVRGRRGRARRLVLRNRNRSHARVSVARPRLSGSRVTVPVRITGLRGTAVIGVVVKVMRGRHAVVELAAGRQTRNGARTFTFRLPRLRHGRYRLVADASVVSGGTMTATHVTAGRAVAVTIR